MTSDAADHSGSANVLLVHQGAEMYGSDVVFRAVVGALRSRHSVRVVLPESGPLADALAQDGVAVDVRPMGIVRRRMASPWGLVRLLVLTCRGARSVERIARDFDADLVYSNTLAVLSGAVAAKRLRVPHVWHVHETIDRPRLVAWALASTACRLSELVIAVSEATAANLAAHCPGAAAKTVVIRNGARPCHHGEEVVEGVRAELGLKKDDLVVTLVGRVSERKGQTLLVRAVGLLPPALRQRVRVLIVGDVFRGNEEAKDRVAEETVRTGLEKQVMILGFRSDIPAIMAASDVVTIPSLLPESAPTVALEAMAASRPVIASSVGGLPEIIADGITGLLIPAGDAEELAAALTATLENETMRTGMGRAGRRRLEEVFGVAAFEDAINGAVERAVDVRERDARTTCD